MHISRLIHAGIDPETMQFPAGHETGKAAMDISAKAKYNKAEELSSAVNGILKKPGSRSEEPYFSL